MRTLVVGDTHGAYKSLMQVLDFAEYDKDIDKLIILGDTQDGWSGAPMIMDYYISLPYDRLVYLLGNHDLEFIEWVDSGCGGHSLYGHGGQITTEVYNREGIDLINQHCEWLRSQRKMYLDDQNRLFVHAGWDINHEFDNPAQLSFDTYSWDRSFWEGMYKGRNYAKHLNEVYVGHSPTTNYKPYLDKPMNRLNAWNLDTAAAFKGRVTVMDIDSKEYWQSDKCMLMYPHERGRN